MEKVYCGNCEHFDWESADKFISSITSPARAKFKAPIPRKPTDAGYYAVCLATGNIDISPVDTWYRHIDYWTTNLYDYPDKLNMYNDCKFYEVKGND